MRNAGTLLIAILTAAAVTACGDDDEPSPDAGSSQRGVECAADNGGITLPSGFCATIFADGTGEPRQIAVTPMGRVFVAVPPSSPTATDGHVLALYDADNDGVAEVKASFGNVGGNGIAWSDGQLYVAANDRIVRYAMPDGTSAPTDATPVVVATDWPATGDHTAKTVAISGTTMFVNVGSPSNSCQIANRQLTSVGKDPCPELDTRAGVWKIDTTATNQTQAMATRVGTGMRNSNALAIDPANQKLWAAINGRDQLNENWPALFTADQDKKLPSDEVTEVTADTDRGWPYCYHDPDANQMKLAPEYGGNGTVQGRCAAIPPPAIAIPAHSAPLAMVFTTGTQFPAAYRTGAFISNHGTRFDVNAPAAELHGYDVEFAPFTNGQPTGELQKFATGFDAGKRPLPDAAPHRPVGLAMMPDGSLLIGDDTAGRIWRVYYTGTGN
jgi:glucose/arabinose dehydrogenase